MKEVDLAYMAGLVDGEGTITLSRHNGKRPYRYPVVSLSSTDREVLEWVKSKFGGNLTRKVTYEVHHLPSYVWRVDSRRAIKVLEKIHQYLRIERKKRRAQYLLDGYLDVTPRNGKYTDEMKIRKEAFEHGFFEST